ncbi:uncharacterized protein LOC133173528 [Saccostrea echinata]|uniref:uncharacterized protein LOC133173528 n=1 Tax=Saccostrea echinata TaxID=191078 RepID=UPI002A80AC50|nr:uncharacterized protein LOC133173528 [Saccostrea echinata]
MDAPKIKPPPRRAPLPAETEDLSPDVSLLYVGVFLILVALVIFAVLIVIYTRALKQTRDKGLEETPEQSKDSKVCTEMGGKREPNRYANMSGRQYADLTVPSPRGHAYTPVQPAYVEIIS